MSGFYNTIGNEPPEKGRITSNSDPQTKIYDNMAAVVNIFSHGIKPVYTDSQGNSSAYPPITLPGDMIVVLAQDIAPGGVNIQYPSTTESLGTKTTQLYKNCSSENPDKILQEVVSGLYAFKDRIIFGTEAEVVSTLSDVESTINKLRADPVSDIDETNKDEIKAFVLSANESLDWLERVCKNYKFSYETWNGAIQENNIVPELGFITEEKVDQKGIDWQITMNLMKVGKSSRPSIISPDLPSYIPDFQPLFNQVPITRSGPGGKLALLSDLIRYLYHKGVRLLILHASQCATIMDVDSPTVVQKEYIEEITGQRDKRILIKQHNLNNGEVISYIPMDTIQTRSVSSIPKKKQLTLTKIANLRKDLKEVIKKYSYKDDLEEILTTFYLGGYKSKRNRKSKRKPRSNKKSKRRNNRKTYKKKLRKTYKKRR